MIGDPVEGLGAQVEGCERNEGAPGRVVEAPRHVGIQRILTGVTPGPVPAVVAERDGLGQCDVQPAGACNRGGELCHFEGVGQACALVILGEHEDLRLAGQAPERRGVQDPVAVALEARPPGIGLLGQRAAARGGGAGGPRRQQLVLELLALHAPVRPGASSDPASAVDSAGPIRAWESAWASRTGPE